MVAARDKQWALLDEVGRAVCAKLPDSMWCAQATLEAMVVAQLDAHEFMEVVSAREVAGEPSDAARFVFSGECAEQFDEKVCLRVALSALNHQRVLEESTLHELVLEIDALAATQIGEGAPLLAGR